MKKIPFKGETSSSNKSAASQSRLAPDNIISILRTLKKNWYFVFYFTKTFWGNNAMAIFKVVGWVNFSSNMSKSFQDGRKEYFPLKSLSLKTDALFWTNSSRCIALQLKQMHCLMNRLHKPSKECPGRQWDTNGQRKHLLTLHLSLQINQPINQWITFSSSNQTIIGTQTTQFSDAHFFWPFYQNIDLWHV